MIIENPSVIHENPYISFHGFMHASLWYIMLFSRKYYTCFTSSCKQAIIHDIHVQASYIHENHGQQVPLILHVQVFGNCFNYRGRLQIAWNYVATVGWGSLHPCPGRSLIMTGSFHILLNLMFPGKDWVFCWRDASTRPWIGYKLLLSLLMIFLPMLYIIYVFMFMLITRFQFHVQFLSLLLYVPCYFIQLLYIPVHSMCWRPLLLPGGLHFTMQVLIYRTTHLLSRTAFVSAYWWAPSHSGFSQLFNLWLVMHLRYAGGLVPVSMFSSQTHDRGFID